MGSDPDLVGVPETHLHAYDAAALASWASSAASASLAAVVLARRLVLSDPVPISTPSTVGIKRQ